MFIETLIAQGPSTEPYVTVPRRQITQNALTILTQNWTWRESLMPKQDIAASQETTPKTLQDDEIVAKRLSKRLSSSSQMRVTVARNRILASLMSAPISLPSLSTIKN
ncbi:hypothetical protein FOMG_19751 [Fusarium oxysporum f. sp. melonis 26406]|uniref:Uncharacterized protein n=1 Tax=Fusarium oxysporum f. sp. melonis 26406 TaxID=1089452 RepID=W9YWB9_FUSOX|nr:hypothetical protein FOMG_19751 [Fusarium oxysporum f. sp. melonis 26406]